MEYMVHKHLNDDGLSQDLIGMEIYLNWEYSARKAVVKHVWFHFIFTEICHQTIFWKAFWP